MPLLASLQESAVSAGAEEIVLRLLYQLIAILLATRAVTWIVRRLGQTDVSGEILAGLLLGPSFLGALAPEFMRDLFHPSTSTIFVGLAQVGLVLLMFQIGLEFEFRRHLGRDRKLVTAISVVGIAIPFVLGLLTAPFFHGHLHLGPGEALPPLDGFRLFFAVALSITAIPVLGRILMELRLSHTRTAALTIGAAAIDDVIGWLLLGAISLLVAGQFSLGWTAARFGGLVLYVGLVLVVLRPLLRRAVSAHLHRHGGLRLNAIASLLLLLFASACITSNLGVFAIIGGFVIGLALHDDRRFVQEWKDRVSPLVNALFLPIFFLYTGLRTDIGSLQPWFGVWLCFLVLAVAIAGKFGGAYATARLLGEDHRSAATIGICMNTRGLMELIVINIGKDLGLLPTGMFTMLVIMALVTTFMASPLIRRLMKGQEAGIQESVARSSSP